MFSDYVQAFFGSDTKKALMLKTLCSKNYNLRTVAVDTESNDKSMAKGSSLHTGSDIEKKTNFTYEKKSSNYINLQRKNLLGIASFARRDLR